MTNGAENLVGPDLLDDELARSARLLATARMVFQACSDLAKPDHAEGAFSVLVSNEHSPYQSYVPAEQRAEDTAYLKSLGYHPSRIRHVIMRANDSDPNFRRPWNYPDYGITARESGRTPDGSWGRTISITVENPEIAMQKAERGWGIFKGTSTQAAFALIMRSAEVHPQKLDAIQTNLDFWDTAKSED